MLMGLYNECFVLTMLLVLLQPHNKALVSAVVQQPASISCNAAYSSPCARTNAEWLAVTTAAEIEANTSRLSAITRGEFNRDTGFYPFVFERANGTCVEHGTDPSLVGLTLAQIFDKLDITYSDPDALHKRFRQGGWVQYLWSDDGSANSKLAYVVPNVIDNRYYLGVGYEKRPLPLDLPCSHNFDSWCSIAHVRSLVGQAQVRLSQAESKESFEAAVFDLSFNPKEDPGGFYTFMYSFDGPLMAHADRQHSLGQNMSDIFEKDKKLGSRQDGADLHKTFVQSVQQQDTAWVQYQWRNNEDEETYTKIAFLVKIEFENDDKFDQYYLGVGFNFAVREQPKGPLGQTCLSNYSLPCAFRTSFQLSSHVLSHAISSPLPVAEMFHATSHDPSFRAGSFYVFVYDYNSTCVAHGDSPDYVGLSLGQIIFKQKSLSLDAKKLHNQFRAAAEQGGGWVLYNWTTGDNEPFQKISYLFQINLDGESYYGGVGFYDRPFPHKEYLEIGRKHVTGDRIPCSQDYLLDCSKVNAQSILGQVHAELTLATSPVSNTQTTGDQEALDVDEILHAITDQDQLYMINDFSVSVFSVDGSECPVDDGSGCCLAHGSDPSLVNKTWQQIFDEKNITAERGIDLHKQLANKSNIGVDTIEYRWKNKNGTDQTKLAWTSRYRNNGDSFYIVSGFVISQIYTWCGACPPNKECTDVDQVFCQEIEITEDEDEDERVMEIWVSFLIGFACLGIPLTIGFKSWRSRIYMIDVKRQLEAFKDSILGMKAAKTKYYVPTLASSASASRDADVKQPRPTGTLTVGFKKPLRTKITWCWQEVPEFVDQHDTNTVVGDQTDCWIKYDGDSNNYLETAFQKQEEMGTFELVHGRYVVDFDQMLQTNTTNGFYRNVKRLVEQQQKNENGSSKEIETSDITHGEPLPTDIAEEPQMVLVQGDIVKLSKPPRPDGWAFGTKLFHADEAVVRELVKFAVGSSCGGDSNEAHVFSDSGWFPLNVVRIPSMEDLEALRLNIGGDARAWERPAFWDDAEDPLAVVEKFVLSEKSFEYKLVVKAFKESLSPSVKIVQVQRIQNIGMWESYVVKRNTVWNREVALKNVESSDKAKKRYEKKWLWHGRSYDTMNKILHQGFNRSFCGENSTMHGRGVYFARDAEYFSWKMYADPNGDQYITACRVVVGEYCKGKVDAKIPDIRDTKTHTLYDSTVGYVSGDSLDNPSIYVTYHDAQAYPEYLIKFRSL